MRFRELFESPDKIPPVNFPIENDDVANRAFAKRIMRRVAEVIEETPDYKIVRTGDGENGWIILFNIKKETADYVVRYKAENRPWMNRTVTQCIIWRQQGSIFVQGLTQRMFFDYLLPRYKTIISDKEQTDFGHRFWVDRMAQANARGLFVGIVDVMRHTIIWYDSAVDMKDWINGNNIWQSGRKYKDLRYIISSEPPN